MFGASKNVRSEKCPRRIVMHEKIAKNVSVDLDPLHADSQNVGRTFEPTYEMPQNVRKMSDRNCGCLENVRKMS